MSRRTVVLLLCSILAAAFASLVALAGPAPAVQANSAGTFVAVAPTRLLDTRSAVGGNALAGNSTLSLLVTGTVVPAGASAVMLNVTVTQPTAGGYITVWGDDTARPTASNLNFSPGQTVPNSVLAPVGANGKVDFFNGSLGTTQLLADVSGYYVGGTPTTGGALQSVEPTRLLDTRLAGDTPLGTNEMRPLKVTGATVPDGASAVVLNVTVTQPTAGGYITVWGDGSSDEMCLAILAGVHGTYTP